MMRLQNTIISSVTFAGIGIHSGCKSTINVKPSEENTGITFIRTDLDNIPNTIKISPDNVVEPIMCTRAINTSGAMVSVTEHLLAALNILRIDNAIIEINCEEIPIMDGSALCFTNALKQAGIVPQRARITSKIITDTFIESNESSYIKVSPPTLDTTTVSIKLDNPRFANFSKTNTSINFNMDDEQFLLNNIALARTFGWFEDGEKMVRLGLAKGVNPENTVLIMPDGSLYDKQELRIQNEFICHKALDLIGDFAILGDIIGTIEVINPSHLINNLITRRILAH